MKLGPVTKLDKRNKTTSKKFDDNACQKIVTSLPFLQFTANLEQLGSQISDAYSIKVICTLIVTFYFAKTEKITKNL